MIVYASSTEFGCSHGRGSSEECGSIRHISQNSAIVKCGLMPRTASSSLLSLYDEAVMTCWTPRVSRPNWCTTAE